MRDFQPVSGAPVPEQWLTPDGSYLLTILPGQSRDIAWNEAWDADIQAPDPEGPEEGC